MESANDIKNDAQNSDKMGYKNRGSCLPNSCILSEELSLNPPSPRTVLGGVDLLDIQSLRISNGSRMER